MNLPIALTYSATLLPGGAVRPQQQAYFRNPYNEAAWIDEMHFVLSYLHSTSDQSALFKAVKMRFKIDNRYVIEDFVPLDLICPRADIAEVGSELSSTFNLRTLSFFWKLPKALWIDKREDLSIELIYDGQTINNLNQAAEQTIVNLTDSVQVDMTIHGRSTSEKPEKRFVPYVTHWEIDAFKLSVNDSIDDPQISPDSALFNGRNQPVFITRMLSDINTGDYPYEDEDITVYQYTGQFLARLRISHSFGYYILKDATSLSELFSGINRVMDLNFVMNPKEFITLELSVDGFDTEYEANELMYAGGFSIHGYSIEKVN